MRKIIYYLAITIVIIFVLTIERVFGLPLWFFTLTMVGFSKLNDWTQFLLTFILGLFLSAIYNLSFSVGVLLVGLSFLFFQKTAFKIRSNTLRLLTVILFSNFIIYFLSQPVITIWYLAYHLLMVVVINIGLLLIAGLRFRSKKVMFSKRFDL